MALLQRIRRNLVIRGVLPSALPALGLAFLISAAGFRFFGWSWGMAVPAFILVWALVLFLARPWSVTLRQIAFHLNARFPHLEESTHLLLKPAGELSLLERMQTGRLLEALRTVDTQKALKRSYRREMFSAAACLLVGLGILAWPAPPPEDPLFAPPATLSTPFQQVNVPARPRIAALSLTIAPPSYTGGAVREQETADVSVEEGGTVTWRITTDIPARRVELILGKGDTLPLRRQKDSWSGVKTITQNSLYQIRVDGELSEFYRLEAIRDKPPVLVISAPEPYVEIPYGKPTDVRVQISLKDDYGLREAFLVATVAKGSGEAVKFREEKISLGSSFPPFQKESGMFKMLQSARMDMAPGDELYFYVQATDNHAQSTRSDTYIISLQDTAQVTLAEAMTMGINPVPEYFRSQRQIIIDTEKLLKEAPRLKENVFKERSNAIGIDQKVLRLRYGKFLGEEFEDMIGEIAGQEKLVDEGHFDGDGHDHSGDLQGLEAFVHAHDESEEATFLEPAVKTKLKACLAQMWEAELRLRTYRLKEALPYEYQALKLLQEVQQSSRAYVARTGFEPPPLKPQEKRLTGELDKIGQPVNRRKTGPDPKFPAIREAVPVLAKLQEKGKLTKAELGRLEAAGSELGEEAIRQPGRYLAALRALRQLVSEAREQKVVCEGCLPVVQKAFWSVLPPAGESPGQTGHAGSRLGEMYLKAIDN